MLAVLWGVLFVASGMLIALMLLLIRPFLSAPKNLPSFVFFAGLALEIIGVAGNAIVMAHLPLTFMVTKEVPNFYLLVPVAFPLSFISGFALNAIYLIANRRKLFKSDLIKAGGPILIGFVLLVIFKLSPGHFLGLGGQNQQAVTVLFSSILSLLFCVWLQFELNQNLKIAEQLGTALRLVSHVNFTFINTCIFKCTICRFHTQIRSRCVFIYPIALFNTGSLSNPFIGCIHHGGQFVIAENAVGRIGTGGADEGFHKVS